MYEKSIFLHFSVKVQAMCQKYQIESELLRLIDRIDLTKNNSREYPTNMFLTNCKYCLIDRYQYFEKLLPYMFLKSLLHPLL